MLLLLGRQSYTLAELRRKLERRGAADLADELLERLVELRLADDAVYSEQYVSSRKSARGKLTLAAELRRRGVEADLVSNEVGKLTSAQQLDAAVGLLEKSAWRYQPAAEPDAGQNAVDKRATSAARHRAKAKAFAFLARRGFDAETAAQALAGIGWFESGED